MLRCGAVLVFALAVSALGCGGKPRVSPPDKEIPKMDPKTFPPPKERDFEPGPK